MLRGLAAPGNFRDGLAGIGLNGCSRGWGGEPTYIGKSFDAERRSGKGGAAWLDPFRYRKDTGFDPLLVKTYWAESAADMWRSRAK